ncbi:MAG: TonB-dependent receptor, partial [Rivularia sp. ALOHA_DT_140]|nr:TonB-dependent receptor [Rivularia sp. ALOHA_DT_140]
MITKIGHLKMKQFFYTAIISVFCLVLPQPSYAQENLDKKENLVTETTENLNSNTPQFNITSLETADIKPTVIVQKRPQEFQDIPLYWNVTSEREIKEILINYLGDIAKKIAQYSYSPKYERGNELGNYITMQQLNNPKLLTAR